ncbi:copper amine oxidase N-terminal domain-containing protein [Paenibacillus humicus]|uniref:copper amine oxidase N-terminal domain-containing protein n=1 Tax=Paenibacillus humicus TaxID=412861 RepID=UPI003D26DA9A
MKNWLRHAVLAAAAFIVLLANLPAAYAAYAPATKLIVEGKTITERLPVITDRGRTLVPLRIISEALDAKVQWDSKTSTVTVQKWGERLSLKPGTKKATLRGTKSGDLALDLDAPAKLKNGIVYVPMRLIAHSFGYQVEWTQGEIRIYSPLSEETKNILYRGSLEEARPKIMRLIQSVHYMNPPLETKILDENYDRTFIFPEGEALGYYYIYGDTISWVELQDGFLVCTWQANFEYASIGHTETLMGTSITNSTGKAPEINKNLLYYSYGIFGDSSHTEYGMIDTNYQYTTLAYERIVGDRVTDSEGVMGFTLPGEVRTDYR